MADPAATVEHVVRTVADPTHITTAVSRSAASTLNDGLPGTALLLAALSPTDPSLAPAAEHHWDAAASLLAGAPPDGIYSGPGALAASLLIGSAYLPEPRVQRTALEHATSWLAARAQGLAHHQRKRLSGGQRGTPWGVYDAIKGLSGIGRILLAADQTGHAPAVPGLTDALTALTEMINTPVGHLPGWWLPAHDHLLPVAGALSPSGAATTGLAHGIAGPLAFLSLAAVADRTVPAQLDAIRTAAAWLLRWSAPGGSWPAHISGDALRQPPNRDHLATAPGRRDAWCYGAAGIGSALTHAGRALHDGELVHAGQTAVASLAQRPAEHWDTDGPGLCHGTAGVLQAIHRSGCSQAGRRAAALTTPLLPPDGNQDIRSGNLGFLTGATGVALVLAETQGLLPTTNTIAWDALLLLS
ncbi:lanthionine synthetase C family protein [Streptomyces sp. 110]|uniref:Lanthionine synthetase C family protein n=1 Tax=Streptomyces endocoffeicus TaxID=2898945 RepID=A0ABS1Q3F0_9ACTN|nr:lanthionine synthetase C family protein [Streptomyces endocoffeicus]MBL1119188.1 lanthionine synthetase C family protein [Streptomyces endocoffeicus]